MRWKRLKSLSPHKPPIKGDVTSPSEAETLRNESDLTDMADTFDRQPSKDFGDPATYRIVVRGTLVESWRERLAGMAMSVSRSEEGSPMTTLLGEIRDQAALQGVLDSLYALHLPILEVTRVDEPVEGGDE